MDHHLFTRDCITCPEPPPCDCSADQSCIQIARSCTQCASFKCQGNTSLNASGGSGSKGPSAGALAGAVIGSLILVGIAIGAYFWYRRRMRLQRDANPVSSVKETPASASDVLNRPDPNEMMHQPTMSQPVNNFRVYAHANTTINLDPESQRGPSAPGSLDSNPFEDSQSIQTTSSDHGTNVIPIALVPRNVPNSAAPSSQLLQRESIPFRPVRSPDLNLNLEHVNVSKDSFGRSTPYESSDNSDLSYARNSYMSGMTTATDILNEVPTIVTQAKKQFVGVGKAEVVQTPGAFSSMPSTPSTLRQPSMSRPSVRSPLAVTSFGPKDVVREEASLKRGRSDPFGDEHSPLPDGHSGFDDDSMSTFSSVGTPLTTEHQRFRPISMETQAASVIGADIGSAKRVMLGLNPNSPGVPSTALSPALSTPRIIHRMASGRLVTPPTGTASRGGTLQEQQALAIAHAQAKAREQGEAKRVSSGSSVISARDSILESFPFVPPSPISNRPLRSTPPASPLSQQSFGARAPSPGSKAAAASLPAPPDRKTLGMSTGSQMSTASTGLGSFPFQLESDVPAVPTPPSAFSGRQRASLDTLALTGAISSYPLGYDDSEESSVGHSLVGK